MSVEHLLPTDIQLSGTGATVNKFSTDETMSGNSDSVVPTEKAVSGFFYSSFSTGATGPQGAQGSGLQGPQGIQGPATTGVSASYDIVVDTLWEAGPQSFVEYKRSFSFTNGVLTSVGSLASGTVFTATGFPFS